MPGKIDAHGGACVTFLLSTPLRVDTYACSLTELLWILLQWNLCVRISVRADLGLSGKQPGEAELGHVADPLLNFWRIYVVISIAAALVPISVSSAEVFPLSTSSPPTAAVWLRQHTVGPVLCLGNHELVILLENGHSLSTCKDLSFWTLTTSAKAASFTPSLFFPL